MVATTTSMRRAKRPPRDAQRTRQRLVQAAFQEVHASGYQSADIDAVVDKAGVTRGALYHHFEGKKALGIAIVDEVLGGLIHEKWVTPLQNCADPLATLIGIVEATSLRPDDIRGGCPLNNMAQEMSHRDEMFRTRLMKVFNAWRAAISGALQDGQARGLVRRDVDVDDTATFVVANMQGYVSLAKNSRDRKVMQAGVRRIVEHLQTLRR